MVVKRTATFHHYCDEEKRYDINRIEASGTAEGMGNQVED